jgi:nucleotide-binding universal stress UspA family protein
MHSANPQLALTLSGSRPSPRRGRAQRSEAPPRVRLPECTRALNLPLTFRNLPPLIPSVMSRILVAVSSPWASQRVVDTVGDLAKRIGSEVLVAHVSRPSGGEMREQEQADGESAVRLLSEKLAERGVAVQTLLMFSDDIARAILNTAVERDISLIVLGLTGKNVFARLLAGNVPVELIKNTRIPVLLLPPDWAKPI